MCCVLWSGILRLHHPLLKISFPNVFHEVRQFTIHFQLFMSMAQKQFSLIAFVYSVLPLLWMPVLTCSLFWAEGLGLPTMPTSPIWPKYPRQIEKRKSFENCKSDGGGCMSSTHHIWLALWLCCNAFFFYLFPFIFSLKKSLCGVFFSYRKYGVYCYYLKSTPTPPHCYFRLSMILNITLQNTHGLQH